MWPVVLSTILLVMCAFLSLLAPRIRSERLAKKIADERFKKLIEKLPEALSRKALVLKIGSLLLGVFAPLLILMELNDVGKNWDRPYIMAATSGIAYFYYRHTVKLKRAVENFIASHKSAMEDHKASL